MSTLKELYYDPTSGFQSANKLYKKAISNGLKVTLKQVQDFVTKQVADQITKQVKKPKIYNTIGSDHIKQNYQMDIMIYDRYTYHNYKYILVVIDVYSRYAQCVAMTNRNIGTIIEATKKIFHSMGKPKNLNCDNEFNTTEFNKFLSANNIHAYYSEPYEINKNAIVERFNRTLAMMLQRWRVGTGFYDWPKVLDKIVANYNGTYHTTTKGEPEQIWAGKAKNMQQRIYLLPMFKVGDQVRLKNKEKVFDKGDKIKYSKKIYIITNINGNKIKVKDSETNEEIAETFKPYTLIAVNQIEYLPHQPEAEAEKLEHVTNKEQRKLEKANKDAGVDTANIITTKRKKEIEKEPEEEEYEIEKIVDQQKGDDGRMLYRIRWKGYEPKDDTWQLYKDVKGTEAYNNWLKKK